MIQFDFGEIGYKIDSITIFYNGNMEKVQKMAFRLQLTNKLQGS